ncbi:protein kinase domain-containing protein [Sorangium sp. So ce131]|uniref:protein kinase domain-containing protein n=1 Tax=Sorangium sp. So ce131 TaxID=3133282 RepID=UPI003F61CC64
MTLGLEATRLAAGEGAPAGEGDERAEGGRQTWHEGAIVAGRYRLDRRLGEGGMGVIWAARHTTTGRPVALKFVKGGSVSGTVGMRLLREAKLASAVRHPNVIEVYDIELEGGAPVMVMELLSGESLASRLSRGPRMPLGEVASIFQQVISAVGAAHALGVVHRDLKPENIFLVDGSSQRVKVLDFGIAKLTAANGQDAQTTGLTESGARLGTPCYMSPEQAFGERQIDHRTDIWSLGLLLYECLSGVLPTRADNAGQVFKIIVTGAIPPLEEVAPDVPRQLSGLVNSMLSTSRDARLSDLREVDRALAHLAQAEAPRSDAPAPRFDAPALGAARSGPPAALDDQAANGDGVDPMAATERPGAAAPPAEGRSTGGRTGLRAAAWKIGAVTALAAAVAGGLALWRRPPQVAAVPVLTADRRALDLYNAALQAARDASEGKALEGLRQAISFDGDFAAAHLRLAMYTPDLAEARASYTRAEALRAGLGPEDRALLEAMEPAIVRDPPDMALCAARLRALTAQRPHEAEPSALLARCALEPDIHTSVAAAARAVEIDRHYAQGWAALAQASLRLGRFSDAAAALDRCLASSPGAASCHEIQGEYHSALGRCADVEQDLRLALGEKSAKGHLIHRKLASSRLAQGRPRDEVLEVMRQSWASLPESEWRSTSLIDESSLNAMAGNFSQAEEQLRKALFWIGPDSRAHVDVVRALIDIYLETDRKLEAANAAQMCLNHHSACASGSPDLLRVMMRAGLLSRAAFQEKRAEHLARSSAPGAADLTALVREHARWIEGPEEAAEAVPTLPQTALMSHQIGHEVQADIGAVFYLAGMPHHALPALRRAVTTCDVLDWPVRYVRSFWFLGQALERTGNVSGACEAYTRVIERWGNASPRSVTAEQARARARAIGCGSTG